VVSSKDVRVARQEGTNAVGSVSARGAESVLLVRLAAQAALLWQYRAKERKGYV